MGQEPKGPALSLSELPALALVHRRYTGMLWCRPYFIFTEPVTIYKSAFSPQTWLKSLFKFGQAVSIASGHNTTLFPLALISEVDISEKRPVCDH